MDFKLGIARALAYKGPSRMFAATGLACDANPAPVAVAAEKSKSKQKSRKLKWKEEREWESIEANILAAENEVSDLEATFAASDFYTKPRAEILEWSEGDKRHVPCGREGSGRAMREASEIHLETQLKTARDKVAHLYARWHELELLQSVPSA